MACERKFSHSAERRRSGHDAERRPGEQRDRPEAPPLHLPRVFRTGHLRPASASPSTPLLASPASTIASEPPHRLSMAISSRLALWEQKIREEDCLPPPTSPPPLFSVIPGGFIKQLVRETEKESKEAKLKGKSALNSKDDPPGRPADGPAERLGTKDADLLDAQGGMAGEGPLLQRGLNGEKHGEESAAAGKLLPLKRAIRRSVAQRPGPGSTPTAAKRAGNAAARPPAQAPSPEKSKGGSPAEPAPGPEARKRGPPLPNKRLGSPGKAEGKAGTEEESPGREAGGTARGKEAGEEQAKPGGGARQPPVEAKKKVAESGSRRGGSPETSGAAGKGLEGAEAGPEPAGAKRGPESSEAGPKGSVEEAKEVSAGGGEEAPGDGPGSDEVAADVWYEAEKVWLVQEEGFALATQLKPDVGTPELPPGTVRVRVEADGAVVEVEEHSVQRVNPPQFDCAEDLASLPSLNESSVLHTLRQRFQSQLLYTYAGPDLIALRPHSPVGSCSKKAFRGRQDRLPPHIFAVAQRALWNVQLQRRDQTILPLGRSGSGRTACCQQALEYLAATAGSVGERVTVEKIQAMFRVLGAFGSVSTGHSHASTRFSMLMSLDFSPSGRITAAHLQTLLLEKIRVAQQPEGESSFNVFAQMLAGLDLDQRTTMHLHHLAESSAFGIRPCLKADEKQEASAAFDQLRAAMGTLGISAGEQGAIWRVLAGIYHLGAAGACRVGRKQFMRFEWAGHAAEALGCDFEELSTAVFKHHLRRIIEQATAGAGGQLGQDEDAADGPRLTGLECVEGMAAGLYEELFAAVVSLINRSFSSTHLSTASITVLDTPGFHNPRHQREERAATFEEFCHNYAHERLQGLFHQRTFRAALERYQEEKIEVAFDLPEFSPAAAVAVADQNPSQVHVSAGGQADAPKGLLWILDEEALIPGSSDSAAVQRLCAYFAREGRSDEGRGPLRQCEQELQFEVAHQLGRDPVRYDAAGWVRKGKWNLAAQNAARLLQQSSVVALRELVLPRAKVPLACRAVAGLEGAGQAAARRVGCVRKTFASSFAAVRKRSVCAQIKLQLDAIINLVKRSQIHFVHCLVPRTEAERAGEMPPQPCGGPGGASMAAWDIPALRVQLSGGQILEAIRLHRIGFADRMGLPQFRRRFQILAQPVMKKFTSAYEMTDESQAFKELLQALDLEKKSFAVGRRQVFLKAGVLPRLEKQREKLVSQELPLLQAACRGFLSRQRYRKLKVQHLAARCIQKNLAVFQAVRGWPWWRLLCGLRPLLTTSLAERQLRAKEELLTMLQKKLENSELSRQELQQSTEALETKVADLAAELSDERAKGDAVSQALEGERAERLRGARQVAELQSKQQELQKKLAAAEEQLEELQQRLQLREIGASGSGSGDEWRTRLDCAETEIAFLRKRASQLEERLAQEQASQEELGRKLREAQNAHEGARRQAQQLQRKCRQLACDLEDARVLMESQQSRNHELEKKQKKFDAQLAQALGESAFERSQREKVAHENLGLQLELGRLHRSLEQKESENAGLSQRVALLASQVQELGALSGPGANAAAALQKRLWDLESRSSEQQRELSAQAGTVEQLEQLHMRLELELERTKQLHQKALEDKEEELEDVRQSCQKRLRQLEMQREQESEEKQAMLREKRDLEGLIATLCEQIGHRDFDVEKRLRRDLKRTHALLADLQLLLQTPGADPGAAGSKAELEKLRGQWEESVARCAEAEQSQKLLAAELEELRTELEAVSRSKDLVDEQLYQLQHEKADLLRHLDEDQEDLGELMAKHKALIAQSASDIDQIRELQAQLEEASKEKAGLQEKLQAAQGRVAYLEQAMVERSVVSRQEALICDLQSKMEFQSVQIKRFEMLVLRLRDSVIKMGEELEKAKESEARESENARYYQVRMEEMKADMNELVQRELEASRRRMELEKQVEELSAVRQTLQADLETSIRRIADLQAALEEVHSSDESDTESVLTARESLSSRQETESQLSVASSVSLNLELEGSLKSWGGSASGWSPPSSSSRPGTLSRLSLDSRSTRGLRASGDPEPSRSLPPASPLGARGRAPARSAGEPGWGPAEGLAPGAQRWDCGKPSAKEEREGPPGSWAAAPSGKRGASPAAEERMPSVSSPSVLRRPSPSAEDKLARSSSALSEYVEELRRKRLSENEPGSLALEDAPSLPIYQTAGASSLRRRRTLKDDGGGGGDDLPGGSLGAGLARSPSLRSVASEEAAPPPRSPALKRVSQFGSCDSLAQRVGDTPAKLRSPTLGSSRLRPWWGCLQASLEDALDADLGREALVFQGRGFAEVPSEGRAADPFAWKIPTLSYERKIGPDADDFPPAIRKTQSASSLSRGPRERKEGQRAVSVRFEDEVAPDRTFLSEMKALLSPGPRAGEDPAHLSDSSDSSGSVVSLKSADSVKSRPKARRPDGEGCVAKAAMEGAGPDRRAEAEGKEDVSSIMMKYLGKE